MPIQNLEADISPPPELGIESVASSLSQFLEAPTIHGIRLGHMTMGRTGLEELRDFLNSPQAGMKFEGLIRRYPEPLSATLHLLTADLWNRGARTKVEAREDAIHLVKYLAGKDWENPAAQVLEEVPKGLLTQELLEQAMDRTISPEPGSIADQLDDLLCTVGGRGLIVTPARRVTDRSDRGFELPSELLSILDSLRHAESRPILEEWILTKFSSPSKQHWLDCIGLLRAVADIAVLVDDKTFVELYAEKQDDLPLLPFQTLHSAVTGALETLRETEGAEKLIGPLGEVKQLVEFRFSQVAHGSLKDAVSTEKTQRLTPRVDDIALAVIEWCQRCQNSHQLNIKSAAARSIKLLEQLGVTTATEFVEFIKEFEGPDSQLAAAVTREAMTSGLLPGTEVEAFREALNLLESNPFFDLADYDWSTIIPPDTKFLEVYYAPGTYDLATKGHLHFLDLLQGYIEYKREFDDSPNTHRLVVVGPITDPTNVPQYSKNPASLYERASSLMICLAGRPDIYITTALQPLPEKATEIAHAIAGLKNNLVDEINRDFGKAGRYKGVDTRIIVCMGSDEFAWKTSRDGRKVLAPQQPPKVQEACLVVGRSGDMLNCLREADRITKLTNANLVLTPGTLNTHSREVVRQIHAGNFSGIRPPLIPFAVEHWSPGAIRKRESRQPARPEKVPSITEIYNELIRELRNLDKSLG